jgi:hypothetical protein
MGVARNIGQPGSENHAGADLFGGTIPRRGIIQYRGCFRHEAIACRVSGWLVDNRVYRVNLHCNCIYPAGVGAKYAPPTDATILLSMEAVFAAVTGFIFLQETMEVIQLVGCGLILAAVLVTQLKSVRVSSANIELMED